MVEKRRPVPDAPRAPLPVTMKVVNAQRAADTVGNVLAEIRLQVLNA